jgi:hypothetical protein
MGDMEDRGYTYVEELGVVLLAVDGGFTHDFCVWHQDGRQREMREEEKEEEKRGKNWKRWEYSRE